MTVLVAGGSGRLGRLVVRSLIADGMHVRVLTRYKERAIDVQALGAEPVVGDLSDSAAVDRAVEGCSTVIAAASGFGPMGSASPRSVDRDGTATLISRSEQAGVARFVLVSMQGAAPRATLEILRMKDAAEQVLRSSGMTWTIIRPAPFLETYLEVVGQPMQRRNATLVFGKGNVAAEFVPVADVAALVCAAVRHPERGGGIVEGRGEERTLNELSETVHRAAGRPGRTIHVPVWFMRVVSVAARPVSPFASRAAAGAVWITSRRR